MQDPIASLEPLSFGESHFAAAQLGDRRRTARLVRIANALTRHPGGTLPEKFRSPAELEAVYHLMNCPTVTHESVLAPHRARTLERIADRQAPVLILHDTTELDFTTHRALEQTLGQIGNGGRRGYLCHNALAVDPRTREVIGLTGQILHRRARVRKGETQAQRRQRADRESRLWLEGVQPLPGDWNLIDVCDRGADTFEFLESECRSGRRFVVRSAYNRAMQSGHDAPGPRGRLHTFARLLPPLATWTKALPGRTVVKKPKKTGRKTTLRRPARDAVLQVAAAPVLLGAPHSKNGQHGNAPLRLWIVRVWEPHPPEGQEGLEWFLLTNQPVETPFQAREVVGWYECRWIIEEYHKAQKTGCGIENPQFTTEERLQPMLALLSVVALTLLNLREQSRRPDAKTRPATDLVSPEYVALLSAWRHGRPRPQWSIHEFFFALARLGGHLNRKHDHHPGWLVLWRGWTHLQAMLDGARAIQTTQRCA